MREIVDERLDGRGVLRCALDEAERMLVTLRVDPDRRDQDQIFVHVNVVDLDHQQIETRELGTPSTPSCAPPTA